MQLRNNPVSCDTNMYIQISSELFTMGLLPSGLCKNHWNNNLQRSIYALPPPLLDYLIYTLQNHMKQDQKRNVAGTK